MNGLHGYLYSKEKLQKEACKRRDRELITKEVLQIKKAKNCAHTKQAMTYLAWSTGPCQALVRKNNTLFVLYRCFTNVLRNIFAKRVYDTKKRGDVHAACKNVSQTG